MTSVDVRLWYEGVREVSAYMVSGCVLGDVWLTNTKAKKLLWKTNDARFMIGEGQLRLAGDLAGCPDPTITLELSCKYWRGTLYGTLDLKVASHPKWFTLPKLEETK